MCENRRSVVRLLALISPAVFSGCAVYMAAKGHPEPYGGGPSIGQERGSVIANMGPPKQSIDSNGRKLEVYEYKSGDKPSPGRAVVHGVLDLMTLCIWEIIGTPIEMSQGEKVRITVEYDQHDRVASVLPSGGVPAMATAPPATGEAPKRLY